ncbi:helix-turn-helix domain-containing protein [Streptomyces sp. NPDC093225]|uniref:helix-turn-helix domain-containing protein n=1 Tax=Streptomyces sp. NPDC093225 TaxID=3366034 RepID=UPI003806FAEB
MVFQKPNAGTPASARIPARTARSGGLSGVTHSNIPLTSHFTVVANQLAQHATLSLLAIGVAVHVQSLPEGTPVSIKALADRFPETEHRIGRALRELEQAGYLRRSRLRLPAGQVITRTVSYNVPLGVVPPEPPESPDPPPPRPPRPPGPRRPSRPQPGPETAGEPARIAPDREPASDSGSAPGPASGPASDPDPAPEPAPQSCQPQPDTRPEPGSAPERPKPTDRPHWTGFPTLLQREAAHLLAGLRAREPRLLLAERDVERLVPDVVRWLETAPPEAVRRSLTADVPPDLRNPAGLLAYRLKASFPVPVPQRPPLPAGPLPPDRLVHPFQTCDGCDRAFRSSTPGRCRSCTHSQPEAA